MAILRQVLVPRTAEGAAAVRTRFIPPMPLSHLVFTVIGDMAASFDPQTRDTLLIDTINRLTVFVEGDAVVSVRPQELMMLNHHQWMHQSQSFNQESTNATHRTAASLLIPFGRKMYWPEECLPAFAPGQVELQYDLPAVPAAMATRTIQVDAVYLPDAQPTRWVRYRDIVRATNVVGFVNDLSLPVAHQLVAILLRGNTPANASASLGTIEQIRILGDDRDVVVQQSDWYSLWADSPFRAGTRWIDPHDHVENTAGAYTQNAETRYEQFDSTATDIVSPLFAFLDLDPNHDGAHLLDTTQFNTLTLRVDAGQTDEIRIVPINLVTR